MKAVQVMQSTNAKLIVIAVLILLILIPMNMIESLIDERQSRKTDAIADVTTKWGKKQTITGPVITIPYIDFVSKKDGSVVEKTIHKHILPAALSIKSSMESELRERGIYEVVLYKTHITLTGYFEGNLASHFNVPQERIKHHQAVLSLGISDMRGILKHVQANFKGKPINIEPGLLIKDIVNSGVHAIRVPIELNNNDIQSFSITLELNGSDSLAFTPLAKNNQVSLQSDWPHPSFSGAFLPKERKINDTGFSAQWNVLNVNRNYPQSWDDDQHQRAISDSAFGVDLFMMADTYTKSDRAIKYALLFVLFTFAAFFCAEITKGNRVHPLQYLLVGLAISIFYVLLVSLSEHIPFDFAYLIASTLTVLLIGLYCKSLFNGSKLPLLIMGMLSLLYGYLYTLMQLEDLALLIGSAGLFVGLATIMFVTRNIDWYQNKAKKIQ